MKKLLAILLFVVMSFSLASCGGEYPESKEDAVPENIAVAYAEPLYYTCAADAKDKTLVFGSKEALDLYYENNFEILGPAFEDFCEKHGYGDAYFEEQVLIGIKISPENCYIYEVQSFEKKDWQYVLTIKETTDVSIPVTPIESPPEYLWIEPEAGHDITASNLKVKWVYESIN